MCTREYIEVYLVELALKPCLRKSLFTFNQIFFGLKRFLKPSFFITYPCIFIDKIDIIGYTDNSFIKYKIIIKKI